jgi:hypothetical protein
VRYISKIFASVLGLVISPEPALTSTIAGRIAIHIKLADDNFGASGETFELYSFEDELEQAMGDAASLEGHEIGGGYFKSYFTASNIDIALRQSHEMLSSHEFKSTSFILITYSDNQTKRIELPITEQ